MSPSHVIKLVRNAIGSKNILYDAEGNAIKWNFFKELVKFKNKRNSSGPIHKLTQAHIDYKSNDMNVRLAVETFGASTANALEFLLNAGYSQFFGAEPTSMATAAAIQHSGDIATMTFRGLV